MEDTRALGRVIELAHKDAGLTREMIAAIGWLPLRSVRAHIVDWLNSASSDLRAIAVRASAVHRWELDGRSLPAPTLEENGPLASAILRRAGELGRGAERSLQLHELRSADPLRRYWAAWSLTLLGDRSALPELRRAAESRGPLAAGAANLVASTLALPEVHSWRRTLAAASTTQRLAVQAAGAAGDPASTAWLLEQMQVPALARVAGESFSRITGVDLDDPGLQGSPPPGFEAGPTELADDESVALDEDENLIWPDPVQLDKWWSQRRSEFRPGVRHLAGQPIEPRWLLQVLRSGSQRLRAAAALELKLLEPTSPLFEVRAPARRQRSLLRPR
jgi:uncharacterized protein (TIGR02270 family)